jgi:hypothetical protein
MVEDSPSRASPRVKRGQPRGADKNHANTDVLQVDQEGHGELRHKYQVSIKKQKLKTLTKKQTNIFAANFGVYRIQHVCCLSSPIE